MGPDWPLRPARAPRGLAFHPPWPRSSWPVWPSFSGPALESKGWCAVAEHNPDLQDHMGHFVVETEAVPFGAL